MPPIKSISFVDGIRIDCEGLPSIWIKQTNFPKRLPSDTLDSFGEKVTNLFQSYYEEKILLSDLLADNPDDRVLQNPPILLPCERIEKIAGKDYLITTRMFVQVHLYSLSPLKYTIQCSDNPITGEWW